ncbi:glycosyltransferase BC10 [Impatiens glandulifera]|uniref:glycosyltransferase BC10 n=1 Tax=Impatiens glandulifera TaxID=253017 RepID=UPI001FB0B8FC|nr:glycosyltransferase BC10 [Impatiens glandulifera]
MKTSSHFLQPSSLISMLLIFAFGLTIGIIFSSYINNNFSLNLHVTHFSFSSSPSSSSPSSSSPSSPSSPPSSLSPPSSSSSEAAAGAAEAKTASIDANPCSNSKTNDTHLGLRKFLEPPSLNHDMNDEELIWRASLTPKLKDSPFKTDPKVAFLFLARGPVWMSLLWEKFFKGYDGLYSVYVHSDPSYNQTDPESDIFHGRRIPSKVVGWGNVNMVEAERRLLANALLDFSNERFVLLSESCIPLFNFSTVYSYLMNSTQNFIEAYDLPGPVGQGRYSPKMAPTITIQLWRKGSQWFQIDRSMAIEVISDQEFFPMFQNHCDGSCYADEHYLPTLVSAKFWEKNSNRTLTWVDWARGGPHPTRFIRNDVTNELLMKLRNQTRCNYNGKDNNICFLFARKFMPNTLDRLLRFTPKIMGFNR